MSTPPEPVENPNKTYEDDELDDPQDSGEQDDGEHPAPYRLYFSPIDNA